MPAGAIRLVPFLATSLAIHVIVLAAAGREPFEISAAPAGEAHEVSIRLEGAAPAHAVASSAATKTGTPPETEQTQSGHRTLPSEPESTLVAESKAQDPPSAEPERIQAGADHPESVTATEADRNELPVEHSEPDRKQMAEKAQQRPVESQPPATERVTAVEDSATGAASTSSTAQRAAAREAIVAELAKHFRYPRLAQKRGWEGTVVLSVRILPDGRLDDVRVIRSSGRSLLDQSARRTLEQVKRLPQFAERIQGNGLALEIPVIYRLQSA